MKEHPYTGELGCFTAYMRTNLPHTRNDLPETHPIQPPPRRAHYTLQTAWLKVS